MALPEAVLCQCCPLLSKDKSAVRDHEATHECLDCGVTICQRIYDAHQLVLTASTHKMMPFRVDVTFFSRSSSTPSSTPLHQQIQQYFNSVVEELRKCQSVLTKDLNAFQERKVILEKEQQAIHGKLSDPSLTSELEIELTKKKLNILEELKKVSHEEKSAIFTGDETLLTSARHAGTLNKAQPKKEGKLEAELEKKPMMCWSDKDIFPLILGFHQQKIDLKQFFQRIAALPNIPITSAWLAWCYWEGAGTIRDINRAKELVQGQDHWFALYISAGIAKNESRDGLSSSDQEKLLRECRLSHDQGDPHATYVLGKCFDWLKLGKSSKTEIFELFNRASQLGHAWSQVETGLCYFHGYGVQKDKKKPFALWKLAAEQGDRSGQANLAMNYEYGWGGIKKDLKTAIKLYRQAASQGHYGAQDALKRLKA